MADSYGMLASFGTPERLLEAVARTRAAGYREIEAYAPFPLEELPEALGLREHKVAACTFCGGLLGALTGWGMQHYSAVFDYALNVGGRPTLSWPAFVPVTFELMVLGAAFSAVGSVLVLSRLPRLHHPLFSSPQFERATNDRFFLCIRSDDERFNLSATRAFLEGLGAQSVEEIGEDVSEEVRQ